MNPSPKNDFTGYNEAHALVEVGIENCRTCTGNKKEERAGWLIAALPHAEKILRRYGLDDSWCSRRKKPKLREVAKTYLLEDLKIDEAVLREMAPSSMSPSCSTQLRQKRRSRPPHPKQSCRRGRIWSAVKKG